MARATPYAWSETKDGPSYYQQVKRSEERVIECDVAVYGGRPAGVTAAVQAARMGRKAILISFNGHVGGMTSAGLTATDVGNNQSIGGLAQEVYKRTAILRIALPLFCCVVGFTVSLSAAEIPDKSKIDIADPVITVREEDWKK